MESTKYREDPVSCDVTVRLVVKLPGPVKPFTLRLTADVESADALRAITLTEPDH